MSRPLFVLSLVIPGFGYLLAKRLSAFAYVFATVVVTFGVYWILIDSVSSLSRTHAAWHVMAVLGLILHVTAAAHGAVPAHERAPAARAKGAPAKGKARQRGKGTKRG